MKRKFRPKPCTACHEEFVPYSSAQKHCFKCGRRRCSKCGVVKDTSEFSYSKDTPDKRNNECKDCGRERKRQRYQDPKERERLLEYKRQRYQDPKERERVLEYRRQRYQDPEFRERLLKIQREYGRRVRGNLPLENRTCERCGDTYDATNGRQVYCETCSTEVKRITELKRRDELANIPPGLVEWSLKYWDYKCPHCGSDLDEYHLDHHFPLTPQEGKLGRPLVPGNIGLLCQTSNLSKGNTDPSEFYTDNILAEIQKFLVRQMIEFDYVPDFTDQPYQPFEGYQP